MTRLDRSFSVPLLLFAFLVIGVLVALASQLSFGELKASVLSSETVFALRFSLTVSLAALFFALIIGIPSAYFLARHDFPGKGLLDTLLDVPLVMPPLVAGVGLLFLFGRTMLGSPLADLGIDLVLSPYGAVVAQTYVATPIVMRNSKAAFESVDRGYEAMAMTLGLTPLKIFFRVNLPLAGRTIVSGTILAWARAIGEFGATLMVAGATRFRTETLPIAVYLNISSGEVGIALSCALVLVVTAFVLLLLLRLLSRRRDAIDNGRAG
ncbi:MAG: ABC transporter permease [Deltaproteobacteria bacterium]